MAENIFQEKGTFFRKHFYMSICNSLMLMKQNKRRIKKKVHGKETGKEGLTGYKNRPKKVYKIHKRENSEKKKPIIQ